MPTENRSSNTEMVSVPFHREDRYIVVKRSDLAKVPVAYRSALVDPLFHLQAHLPQRECLVIESDWPEYEPTWAAIQARVTGQPAPQPQTEPIAWMVGTAFWWTKEEAERDAAATGLPIVGLGPMTATGPAEQKHREPVAWVRFRNGEPDYDGDAVMISNVRGDTLGDGDSWEPVYTHADPGEVERLRLERRRMDQALSACANERDTLRTLLVEALAFLDEAYKHDIGTQLKREIKAFYLSASAEPSAPVAQA